MPTHVKASILAEAGRETRPMLTLRAVWPGRWPTILFLFLQLVFLELVLRKASKKSTSNRAKKPMTALVPSKPASKSTCDGSPKATFAFSRLLAVLCVLIWILAVRPGGDISLAHTGSRVTLLVLLRMQLPLILFLTVRLLLIVLLTI